MHRILKLNERDLSKDILGAEAKNRNSQYQEKYNKDLQNVRDIMAGKTIIDSKYNEELDLDTAKAWLRKDYIYLNNLMSYSPEEIDNKLAEDLPDIFGNDSKTESALQEAAEDEIQEDIDNLEANEELQDTVDSEENQDENPVKEDSVLDTQLNELREVLVDLDLNLYRIASKEDTNNVIYIIGKVAEDNNDTLMLIDNKPENINKDDDNTSSEPIKEVSDDTTDTEDHKSELENRFDFIVLPKSFEEINKLSPRYGKDLTPDHDAIMEYLMNCLIEINPEAAEELQKEEPIEELPTEPIEGEEDLKDED